MNSLEAETREQTIAAKKAYRKSVRKAQRLESMMDDDDDSMTVKTMVM
ncbi:hypothetical protein ABVN80_10640 [Acinetobacter baumannii]